MIWLLLSAMILWLILEVYRNYGQIENISWLWHAAAGAMRGVISFYMIFMYFNDIWITAKIWLCFNAVWGILFDILINLKRKKRLFYVGSGSIDRTVKWIAIRNDWNAEDVMIFFKLTTLGIALTWALV